MLVLQLPPVAAVHSTIEPGRNSTVMRPAVVGNPAIAKLYVFGSLGTGVAGPTASPEIGAPLYSIWIGWLVELNWANLPFGSLRVTYSVAIAVVSRTVAPLTGS